MQKTTTKCIPLRLDPAKLAGKELDEYPPMPNQPEGKTGHILDGLENSKDRGSLLFEGEIVMHVAEMEPRRMQVVDLKVDEFVYILEGKLILTCDNGQVSEYGAGDFVVVPKGFTGIREMAGSPYRELTVIEAISMAKQMKEMGIG